MPYYTRDLGLNILNLVIQTLTGCDQTRIGECDPTRICKDSICVGPTLPWECQPTIVKSPVECDPTKVCNDSGCVGPTLPWVCQQSLIQQRSLRCDATKICNDSAVCVGPTLPWECQQTVICSAKTLWECAPTAVCWPPSVMDREPKGGVCPGDSCLANSGIMVKPSAVANLDELQAELKAAMRHVQRLQQNEDAAKSVEELKESEQRLTEQLERTRKQLRDRGE